MNRQNSGQLTRIGLNSLRHRYIAVNIIISLLLFAIGFIGWRHVEEIRQTQLIQVQERAVAADALSDLILQINTLETSLFRFIIQPTSDNKLNINRAFDLYDAAIVRLNNNGWIMQDQLLLDLIMSMKDDRIHLYSQVENLIVTRTDDTKWFPAMTIMQERMLGHNLQFMASLDLMIKELGDELIAKKRTDIYKLLVELRHTWQMMISEFRLFVSNSFGVFANDSHQGMLARRENIEIYMNEISSLLEELNTYIGSQNVDPISASAVEEMYEWRNAWEQAYQEVDKTFESDNWRNDLRILRDNIEPLIERIQQRSSSLQLELGVASAKDISRVTGVAQELSDSIIYFAIGLSLTGIIGYVVFQRSILKPISNIAAAFKSEALDKRIDKEKLSISKAEEIQALTDAFQEMREQITVRQAHLDHLAHHDALTQLPNRVLLRDRLSQAIARAKRDRKMVGLMFLDLDRFKQINDTLGHHVGDELLKLVATRISHCVRETDTVSRLGGDEFAIVVEGVVHADQVAATANKILSAFKNPFVVDNTVLHSSTSIGIALGPNDDNNVDSLIKDADIAMYHAKDQGKNTFKFYSTEMAAQVARHMQLETELRDALEYNQLLLFYQPIIDLKTGAIISTEALLRWEHPERGLLSAGEFLPVVEESGLILPITQWVVTESSRQHLAHCNAGFGRMRMAINLPGKLLRNESFMGILLDTIKETGIDPSGLLMEITEDTLLEDLHGSQKTLSMLHTMGIGIALDDFGTGQSSLSHLRRNPIDVVKIDRDFIRAIPNDKHDSELVDAVIAMAHKLKMKVVAEGVETKEQLDFLKRCACDAIQGFYYSRPISGKAMLDLLLSEQRKISRIQ